MGRIELLYIAIHNWVIRVEQFKTEWPDKSWRFGGLLCESGPVVRLTASWSLHSRHRRVAYI